MATLVLKRERANLDKLRKYDVFCENTLIGTIKEGETESFDIKPGTHEIQLKIDWMSSNKLTIEIKQDESVFLTCCNKHKGLSIFSLMYILFKRKDWIWLKQSALAEDG